MELILKHLASASKIIAWLSLKKVLLLSTITFGALALFTAYEQREQLVEAAGGAVTPTTHFKVSTEMQDRIRVMVNNSSLITTITVLEANLKINERDIVFRYGDDPSVNDNWEREYSKNGTIQPIFTRDSGNNAQMVALVNGEFNCYKFSDTVNKDIVPQNERRTPVVCRISLPPYYGEFAGYLGFALSRTPSPAEQDELQLEARRLANEIFFKNIVNR